MSKKSEAFIDKYVVGKDDWLLKHKEVIAKLLDEYETDQLTIPDVVGRREQLCDLDGKTVLVKFKVTKYIPKIIIEDI